MLFARLVSVLVFSSLLIALTASPFKAWAQNVMRIAAVVNDNVITQQDLGERIKLTIATSRIANTPEMQRRLAGNILRTMIDEQLKLQQAEELNIEVTDKQLQRGLTTWARSAGIPFEQLDNALKGLRVDKVILEDQARAEIGWSIAVRRLGQNRLKVSDKELDQAMAEIAANKGKPEYLYSEIFLPVNSPAEEGKAIQLAQRLHGFLKQGSVFSALARDFSQSPSAIRGGDLGWVQSGQIDAILEQTLRSMASGSFSAPIRLPSGFMIVSLRDKRIAGQEDQDEILSIAQAPFVMPENASEDQVTHLQGMARTLLMQANSCEQMVEMARAQGLTQAVKADNLKLSNLPAELRAKLGPLKTDQSTISVRPNVSVVALRICDRKAAPVKPEIAKRKEIQNALKQEKYGREERRILQKLRRDAFVDIRL